MLKSCPTLCNHMDCSMPGLTALHYLLEFVKTHVHWIGDAIKPFHPLLSPFPEVLNFSQHQGLFQWVSSLHKWPKCCSFSIRLSNEYSGLFSFRSTGLISLLSKGLSRIFSNTMQKHPFFGPQDFPGGLDGEESTCNVSDSALIHEWERFPEEGNGSIILAWRIP